VVCAGDDASGVATTEFRVDDGEWTAYTDTFQVTGSGDHTVQYRSTDVAGNAEEDQSITVSIGEPEPVELSIVGTVEARCEAGSARVAVYAINTGNVWADITIATPWGDHTIEHVAPGSVAYHLFDTGTNKLKKGTVTVSAFHTDGARDYSASTKLNTPKHTCR
jgi:hypothetical protein